MMLSRNLKWQVTLLMLLAGAFAAMPVFAGSAVIGSVAGSMNATIGGQALVPNTTIFSGDSLQVNDGVAVVAVDKSSRMVFGRETTASFLRDSNEVTVLLSRGSLTMYHPQEGGSVRVKVGDVSVVPAKGFKTLGEVAMLGGNIIVTAKEGSLRVEGSGSALDVAKGKTITIPTKSARAAASPARPAVPGGAETWSIAATAAGGAAAALAGVAISRADDARDAANAANATAAQADADAKAATAAANAANATAVAAGCAGNFAAEGVKASPFTPPAGTATPFPNGC